MNKFDNNLEKFTLAKDENIFVTFLGAFVGSIGGILVSLFIALMNETSFAVVFAAILAPGIGSVVANSLLKNKKNKLEKYEEVWEEKSTKFSDENPKSKFFSGTGDEITRFCMIFSVIFSYLIIYVSEILTLSINLKKQYPETKFSTLLADVVQNIFKVDWARKYLVQYWIFLTVLYVVFFVVIGIVLVNAQKEKGRKLPEEKQKKLAYGAVLAERNGMSYESVKGGNFPKKEIRTMLKRDWDIKNKAEAVETLEILINRGQREGLDIDYKNIKDIENGIVTIEDFSNRNDILYYKQAYDDVKHGLTEGFGYTEEELNNIKTLGSWDYDRAINVARFSHIAGYITEDEMWQYIDRIIIKAKMDYNNWREYFAGVLFGRNMGYNASFNNSKIIAVKLLNNPNSVYNRFEF